MPRDGAIIFSDLIGKLDVPRVRCSQCGRDGCYGLSRLITQRGRDAKIIDWLDELTAECPKKDCPQHERSMRGRSARNCRSCCSLLLGHGAMADFKAAWERKP